MKKYIALTVLLGACALQAGFWHNGKYYYRYQPPLYAQDSTESPALFTLFKAMDECKDAGVDLSCDSDFKDLGAEIEKYLIDQPCEAEERNQDCPKAKALSRQLSNALNKYLDGLSPYPPRFGFPNNRYQNQGKKDNSDQAVNVAKIKQRKEGQGSMLKSRRNDWPARDLSIKTNS